MVCGLIEFPPIIEMQAEDPFLPRVRMNAVPNAIEVEVTLYHAFISPEGKTRS